MLLWYLSLLDYSATLLHFATILLTASPTASAAPALLLYETYQLRARLHSLKPGSLEDYDEAKEFDSDLKEISTPHDCAKKERWNSLSNSYDFPEYPDRIKVSVLGYRHGS